MTMWVLFALALTVSGQLGGPKWNNPMHIEDFNVNVCVSAPQAWALGAKHCPTSDIKSGNNDQYQRAIAEAQNLGFTGVDDAWMSANTCTAYTRGGNNCAYFCAARGTNCLAASVPYGITYNGQTSANQNLKTCQEINRFKTAAYRTCNMNNPQQKYACTCGPFVPDCLWNKAMGEKCSSAGDPHVHPFEQFSGKNPTVNSLGLNVAHKLSYMQIGTYRLFNGVYLDKTQLDVQVRMVEHPVRSDVSVNQAFVATGDVLCGHTLSVTAKPADINGWPSWKGAPWQDFVPIITWDGVALAGGSDRNTLAANLMSTLANANCPTICSTKFRPKKTTTDRFQLKFVEGLIIEFDSWYHVRHGLSVSVFSPIHVLQPSATYYVEDKVPALGAGSPAGLNPGGLCFGDFQNSDLNCNDVIFPANSYVNGETCSDHQPDPNRPDFIPDPIKTCKNDFPKVYSQAKALCNQHCPTQSMVQSCLFDACIAGSLDGLFDMANQCDFLEELNELTNPLPTPKPTRACNPLMGIKFKWNKNKKKDDGIRPTPDILFERDIWDEVHLHNHGYRHQQKKFYNNEIAGLTDAQIACLCHDYCYSVGTHWFQSNLKRRKNGNRYGKCQCYNGEPVFKKSRPTYATGYITEKAYAWYYGTGGATGTWSTSKANDMLGKGVTFDVPESSRIETQANPHPGVVMNDREKAGFHTKALRKANKVKSAKWHKKPQKQYRQLGPSSNAAGKNTQQTMNNPKLKGKKTTKG